MPRKSTKKVGSGRKEPGRHIAAKEPATASPVGDVTKPLWSPYLKRSLLAPRTGRGINSYPVPDLCQGYGWPTNLAGGGVIAVIQANGGWVQTDMDSYFQSIGQTSPQITDISLDGTGNKPNQHLNHPEADPDHEVALDIQVAAASYFVATAKPAVIRVYWTQSFGGGITAAANDGCDVCSISWGADESLLGDLVFQIEAAASYAATLGMVVFAASGDNDSSDGGLTPTNVDAPASCPHVIGCGGTNKTASGETVWNDDPGNPNGHGTGGGFSKMFKPQAFQAGAPSGAGRMVPDVAAHAGCVCWVHGAQMPLPGTSCVAPLYAGLFAAFGKKLGFVTPKLWANQLCFNDIREGDNGHYRAWSGPDACTGLGSPIGTKLAALLAKA